MINIDNYVNENRTEHNKKWPFIPDHPYKIIIIGGYGSGKINALINLINEQNDIDNMYIYAKDLSEPKYEYFIKKRKETGIKHLINPNTFIECSNSMDNVYENINDDKSVRKKTKNNCF